MAARFDIRGSSQAIAVQDHGANARCEFALEQSPVSQMLIHATCAGPDRRRGREGSRGPLRNAATVAAWRQGAPPLVYTIGIDSWVEVL